MNARTVFLRKLVGSIRRAGDFQPSSGKAARALSRRDFLRTASLAGAGALAGCATPKSGPAWEAKEGAVAIVGGGVAGLTAAYRLQRRGVEVHLYEAQQRLGGRMWTKRNFNAEGMFCEIGGELVDSGHTALIKLAREIGVGIQPLKSGKKEPGEEYYFIDGKIYTDADLIPAFAPFAKRIAADAEGLYTDDGDYTAKALAFDKQSLDTYLKSAARDGLVPAWLHKALDVAYTTEYGVHTDEQSTMNFVDMISPDTSDGFKVYGDSDEAYRVAGGSGSLPEGLAKKIAGKVEVHQGHRLTGISDDGKRTSLTFTADRASKTVSYTRVILALPFTILRDVSGVRKLALSAAKHKSIQELGYGSNAKAMFGFSSKFWKTLKPASNGGVFSDALFEAWETSQGQRGNSGIITCYIGGKAAKKFSSGSAGGYLNELERAFPGAKAAHDGNSASMDWTHFAFTQASFSATKVGQYCGMIGDAAAPSLDGRLVFAGEHTSEESCGYMNGGVDSGERAAREIMAFKKAAAAA